jgi:hypothetical protein
VQFTSVFTAIVTIISQVPYLESTDSSEKTADVNYFFYANMSVQGAKAFVSLLAYCISASLLKDKATADLTKHTTTSTTDAVASGAKMPGNDIEAGEGDIELHDYIPNPLREAGAFTNSQSAAHEQSIGVEKKQHASHKEMQRQMLEMQKQMQEQMQEQKQEQHQQMQRMQQQMQQQQEQMQQQMLLIQTQMQKQLQEQMLLMMQTQQNQASQGESTQQQKEP